MKLAHMTLALTALLLAATPHSGHAEDKATPLEVIEKVNDAAAYLSKVGEAGLPEFMDRHGRWVWKDTYVFVLRCDLMTVVAHPINPKLVGKNHSGIKDMQGNYFMVQYCGMAKEQGRGWVELWYPKVDERKPSRKLNYVLQVPNTPYQVAAGIYSEDASVQELNQMLK